MAGKRKRKMITLSFKQRLSTFFEHYPHWKLLLYWPLYGLMFTFVEQFFPVNKYNVVHCELDDLIPFNEWFLIPYMFWFFFLIGIQVYAFFRDPAAFLWVVWFMSLTFTTAILFYMLYPTCQMLRPESFVRDNFLTRIIAIGYQMDTNTNVCPSIHVIGSLGVLFASWDCKKLRSLGWQIFFWISTILICISTVFIKQHSVIDVIVALPVSGAAYWAIYQWPLRRRKVKAANKSSIL